MATNFLKYCTSSEGGMALASAAGAGASGIGYAACRIYIVYTWSVEGRCKFCSWGSSTTSFPLPSSFNIGEFFSHGQTAAPIAEDSDNPSEYSTKFSISPYYSSY